MAPINKKTNNNSVVVFWTVPNASDPEDDGTQRGGWIRDQIRANLEQEHGLVGQLSKSIKEQSKKEGD